MDSISVTGGSSRREALLTMASDIFPYTAARTLRRTAPSCQQEWTGLSMLRPSHSSGHSLVHGRLKIRDRDRSRGLQQHGKNLPEEKTWQHSSVGVQSETAEINTNLHGQLSGHTNPFVGSVSVKNRLELSSESDATKSTPDYGWERQGWFIPRNLWRVCSRLGLVICCNSADNT